MINVPKSMLKKFLASNGCRVTPEALTKFESLFREWASNISKVASEKVTAEKRKTIGPEDL